MLRLVKNKTKEQVTASISKSHYTIQLSHLLVLPPTLDREFVESPHRPPSQQLSSEGRQFRSSYQPNQLSGVSE